MAELKTKPTTASVKAFLDNIDDDQRRKDCQTIAAMLRSVTGAKPVMWGSAIVGYGDFEYSRSNGDTFKWFVAGFSPRKAGTVVYLIGGPDKALLAKLGKHKMSAGSCLEIKRLDDVHQPTLKKLVETSVKNVTKRFARKK